MCTHDKCRNPSNGRTSHACSAKHCVLIVRNRGQEVHARSKQVDTVLTVVRKRSWQSFVVKTTGSSDFNPCWNFEIRSRCLDIAIWEIIAHIVVVSGVTRSMNNDDAFFGSV